MPLNTEFSVSETLGDSPIDMRRCLSEISEQQEHIDGELSTIKETPLKVVIFGRTGAGKTTLANHLCGRELRVEKKSDDTLFISGGDGIGNEGASATTLPNFFSSHEIATIDCPGSEDMRGAEQQVKNAFFIQSIFNGHKNSGGINNFVFAILIAENDMRTRGLILSETLRNFIRLVGQPSEEIINNTVLIVTQSEKRPEQLKETLKCLLPSLERMIRTQENEWVQLLVSRLVNDEDQRILTFAKPTVSGVAYEPDTRDQLRSWFYQVNRRAISSLDARVPLEESARASVLELIALLRDDTSVKQGQLVSSIQDAFSRYMNQYEGATFQAQSLPLMEVCQRVKSALADNLKKIDLAIAGKASVASNQTLADSISVDMRILSNLSSIQNQIPDVQNSHLTSLTNQVQENLYQLKSCAGIERGYRTSLVDYSATKNAINLFCEHIRASEVTLLRFRFEELNTSLQKHLESLSSSVISNIETFNLRFERVIQIYRSLKAVMTHFVADNEVGRQLHERAQAFENMLSDTLQTALTTLPDARQSNEALRELTFIANSFVQMHKDYGGILNNTINHIAYIELFRSQYSILLNGFESIIKERLSDEITVMSELVSRVVLFVDNQYSTWQKVEDSEIPTVIDEVSKLHSWFVKQASDYAGAVEIGERGTAALVSIREDLDPEILRRADGLMKIGYTFNILSDLTSNFFEHHRELKDNVTKMAQKTRFLLELVCDNSMPEQLINIGNTDEILNNVLDLSKNEQYRNLVERYMNYLSRKITVYKENFWLSFERSITTLPDRLVALRVFLKIEHEPTPVQILQNLKQHIEGSSKVLDFSSYEPLVEKVTEGVAFYQKHKNLLSSPNSAPSFLFINSCEQLANKFIGEINGKVGELRNNRSEAAGDLLVQLETLVNGFVENNLRTYAQRHPRNVNLMLAKIKKHHQIVPWQVHNDFNDICNKWKISNAKLNLQLLQFASQKYRDYVNFCNTQPITQRDDSKLSQISSEFWSKINELILDCQTGVTYYWSGGRLFRPRIEPIVVSAPLPQDDPSAPEVPVAEPVPY